MPNPSERTPYFIAFYCRKQLISQLLDKISNIWLVNLKPSMSGICMPIFRPLASLVWLENDVTERWMDGHIIFGADHNECTSHNGFSKLPPSLHLWGIKINTKKYRGTHSDIFGKAKFFLQWSAKVLELLIPQGQGISLAEVKLVSGKILA